MIGDRYEVGLLWAENEEIPNIYGSACTQLCSLEQRLEKNLDLKKRYEATEQVGMDDKLVRKFDDSELNLTSSDQQWYAVTNSNKPEKLRRVRNAASKVQRRVTQ